MWDSFSNWMNNNLPNVLIGGLLSSILGPLLFQPARRFVGKILLSVFGEVWAFVRAWPSFMRLRKFVSKEKPLWTYRPAGNLLKNASPPCLMIMNYKGGVGKTTLAANLAAAFSEHHAKRVLLVDLDYQGSLSDLLRNRDEESRNTMASVLSSATLPKSIDDVTTGVQDLPNVKLITSEYDLTHVEENQLQRWLMGDARGDVRSRVARILTSKKLNVKDQFDLVIFDAPPRLSLASVNALRAANFILVPTKLQPLSAIPIAKMVRELNEFRGKIRGNFDLLGVVCNMTHGTSPAGNEGLSYAGIQDALATAPGNPELFSTFIPDRAFLGRPDGANISYSLKGADGQRAREMFNQLSDEIGGKMGIVEPMALAAE